MPRQNQTLDGMERLIAEAGRPMRARELRNALKATSGMVSTAGRSGEKQGRLIILRDGPQVSYDVPREAGPQPFRVCRWADGDIDLYGLAELDDGGMRLTPDMVRELQKLLGAVAP